LGRKEKEEEMRREREKFKEESPKFPSGIYGFAWARFGRKLANPLNSKIGR